MSWYGEFNGAFGNPVSKKCKNHLFEANGWKYRNCLRCHALNHFYNKKYEVKPRRKSILKRLFG